MYYYYCFLYDVNILFILSNLTTPTTCNFGSTPVLGRYTTAIRAYKKPLKNFKMTLGQPFKKGEKTRPFDFGHNESTARERSGNNKPPRLAIGFTGSCSLSLGVAGTLLSLIKFVSESLYGRVNRSHPSNRQTPVGGKTHGDDATNVRRKRFRGEHSTRRRAIGWGRDLKKPRSSRFFPLFREGGDGESVGKNHYSLRLRVPHVFAVYFALYTYHKHVRRALDDTVVFVFSRTFPHSLICQANVNDTRMRRIRPCVCTKIVIILSCSPLPPLPSPLSTIT